jgi:putative ABC transport system permease protein
METFFQDLRYGARVLVQRPGFTIVAVLTLTLGIGASTAIFSVVDAVLLRPLPFPSQQQLLYANGKFALSDEAAVSPPDFEEYRANTQTIEQFAAIGYLDGISNVTGGEKPEQVRSQIVSWNFFDVLGIRPSVGRSFLPVDEKDIEPQVAILGHGIWKRDFGSDPGVVGRKMDLDGKSVTIVGVLPVDLPSLSRAEVWQPLPMDNPGMNNRRAHFLALIARMKPGVSLGQTKTELDEVARGIAAQHADTNEGWSLRVRPLTDYVVGKRWPSARRWARESGESSVKL